jgi:hypothetical protein
MALTESLMIAHGIDIRLKGVDDTVRRVDREVGLVIELVIDGVLFYFSSPPNRPSALPD